MAGTDTRVVLWAAAAVAACAAIAVAVGTATDSRPAALSDQDIVNALAADRPPVGGPNPGPSPSAGPTGITAVLDSPGGSVTAVCLDGMVSLQTWTPHPGYTVTQATHDPGLSVSVRFQSDTHAAITLVVTCVNGQPVKHQTIQQDTQGGTTTTTVPGTDPTAATNPAPAPAPSPSTSTDGHGGRGPGGGGGGGDGGGGGTEPPH
jgi:uncharacterized membrane protein YgcG